jgi:hypothetical protein
MNKISFSTPITPIVIEKNIKAHKKTMDFVQEILSTYKPPMVITLMGQGRWLTKTISVAELLKRELNKQKVILVQKNQLFYQKVDAKSTTECKEENIPCLKITLSTSVL